MSSTTLNALTRPTVGSPSLLSRLFRAIGSRPVAPRSRAEEAAAVRELANRVRRSDPGFAGDLYAAADRHELGGQ
jgi:hypothetical protein